MGKITRGRIFLLNSESLPLPTAASGYLGLHENLKKRANLKLSLSAMTLAHDHAALILVEQLYRAHTILKGEPYHKWIKAMVAFLFLVASFQSENQNFQPPCGEREK